ncbi:HET domain-containing protein [Fusarium falciforme]|uniref:HET domain-containing protein n=1 Tax=Fusarium falciforme TaxID=195108 RepID=UPI002301A504|nr:HET domain-containing protein [Fusarium falciforme]WAO96730.1 HET domain-containing protein [Fusarium falciforme]
MTSSIEETFFNYEPLLPDEIRLLSVAPGNSEPITCDLVHVRLDSKPKFWAMSYVWGARENPALIEVNGCSFAVTRNLYDALREYRRQFLRCDGDTNGSFIWIDAICIEQTNHEEKAIQVPRMSEIYGRCEHVLAWLGPVDDVEQDAVRELAERLEQFGGHANSPSDGNFADGQISAFRESAYTSAEAAEEVQRLRQILINIGQRPWFRRVWILQEAVLSQKPPILLCGPHIFGYDIFFRTWVRLMDPSTDGQLLITFLARSPVRFKAVEEIYRKILNTRLHREQTNREDNERQCALDILQLIGESTELKATVPHDHIYALLGLLDCNPLPEVLFPDYTKPFEDLYHRFTAFILAETRDPRVLNLGAVGGLEGVPSWTPDLRQTLNARINNSQRTGACISLSEDKKMLKMPAILLGRCVSVFGPVQPDPTTETIAPSVFLDCDRAIIQPASSIRQTTRLDIMLQWFRYHLADIFTVQRLERDPTIEQSFLMAYSCMVQSQPIEEYSNYFNSRRQLEGADGLARDRDLQTSMLGHGLFVLHNGITGDLARTDVTAVVGDAVCVFPGLSTPFVLRQQEDGTFRVVSQAALWKYPGTDITEDALEEYRQSFVDAHHKRPSKHEVRWVDLV